MNIDETELNIIDHIYCQSECLYTEQEISQRISVIADRMNLELAEQYPLMLVVMSGALVFAGQLLPRLSFPLTVDYCHISRYRSGDVSSNFQWLVKPREDFSGKVVVVVDDICDEGATLQEVIRLCYVKGAIDVRSCVLVEKGHHRKVDHNFKPDYVALNIADKFLVGSGMDFNGHGRNMPGIFSVDVQKK
jgi:hypoxanthine phosphoribosyltransferase